MLFNCFTPWFIQRSSKNEGTLVTTKINIKEWRISWGSSHWPFVTLHGHFPPHMAIFTSCGHFHLMWPFVTSHGHSHLAWPFSPCVGILTSCGHSSPHVAILTLHGHLHLAWPFLTSTNRFLSSASKSMSIQTEIRINSTSPLFCQIWTQDS